MDGLAIEGYHENLFSRKEEDINFISFYLYS